MYREADFLLMNTDKEKKEEQREEYSLYTEKIVINQFVKHKKLFAALKLILGAVIFGVVATFVMSLLYPWVSARFSQVNEQDRIHLQIDKDQYPSDAFITGQTTIENSTEQTHDSEEEVDFKKVIEKARKSIVTIDVNNSDVDAAMSGSKSDTETVGLVIGEMNGEYIVLASSDTGNNEEARYVKINDSIEVEAYLISMDEEIGISVLGIKKSNIPDKEQIKISVASLDNSYMVKQGDTVMAVGRLYGKMNTADKGLVTGITTESGTDCAYDVIDIGIKASDGDYCYLFNTDGNVIGVSRDAGENSNLEIIGISDLKSLLEFLSIDSDIPYMGIKGTNVTYATSSKYGLPYGVYISDIQIDSPAFNAGIQTGDVIVEFNGNSVLTIQTFREKLYQSSGGDDVEVKVKRPGIDGYRELDFVVTLSVR